MKKYILIAITLILFLGLFWPIRFALFGELGGTFKQHSIPSEYKKLEAYLSSQKSFSRSLWVPAVQRFGPFTSTHPAIPAQNFYDVASISGVLDNLKKDTAEQYLQDASVKYVIVPFDSEGELFLKDRKYDEATYKKTVQEVRKLSWLTEIPGFGKIHVFEMKNPKDHFWTDSAAEVSYTFVSPTEYSVTLKNAQKGDRIVFAESFDTGWKASIGNLILPSEPFEKTFNSFILPKDGNYTLRVFYQAQTWVNRGLWISGITLVIFVLSFLISGYSWFRKSKMVE